MVRSSSRPVNDLIPPSRFASTGFSWVRTPRHLDSGASRVTVNRSAMDGVKEVDEQEASGRHEEALNCAMAVQNTITRLEDASRPAGRTSRLSMALFGQLFFFLKTNTLGPATSLDQRRQKLK